MGTPNIIQNLMSGNGADVSRGFANLGKPVMNNQGVPSGGGIPPGQVPIHTGGGPIMGTHSDPILTPGGTITPPSGLSPTNINAINPSGLPQPIALSTTGSQGNLLGTPGAPSSGVPTPGTGIGTVPSLGGTDAPYANLTPQQQQELNKQLVDIYGKGEGNLLTSLIGSIGSGNDAYLQAYEKAMAGPNAEGLAALNTAFGNAGIGANSSAFAIGNADFQSNIVAQEGLQEQQLQMNDLQQLMNLTQGLQGQSAQEVASGGWASILGGIIGSIPGFASAGKAIGQIGSTGGQSANTSVNPFAGSTEAAPLGAGAIPLGQTDTTTLPGIDDSTIGSFSDLGADVFI